MNKKFFAALLAVCMVVTMLPMAAFAEEPEVPEEAPAVKISIKPAPLVDNANPAKEDLGTVTVKNLNSNSFTLKGVKLVKHVAADEDSTEAYWVGVAITQQDSVEYYWGFGAFSDEALAGAMKNKTGIATNECEIDGETYDTLYWGWTTAEKAEDATTGWVAVVHAEELDEDENPIYTLYTVTFDLSVAAGDDDDTTPEQKPVAPVGPSAKPTKPDTTEPSTTEPGTTEPGTTEPGTTQPAQPTSVAETFTDVEGTDWYLQAVQYVYDAGLMKGKGTDTTFAPSAPITRAECLVTLARRAGVDTEGGSVWYQKGLDWAVANGVSSGANPSDDITRQELITMLYRQAGNPGVTGDLTAYSDGADVGDWAADAMMWATQNGIINGSAAALNPKGTATRAEVATMLMNFCQQYPVDAQ